MVARIVKQQHGDKALLTGVAFIASFKIAKSGECHHRNNQPAIDI